jgi:hypothetical protein
MDPRVGLILIVIVLGAMLFTLAMPTILENLQTTRATATGISTGLDLSINNVQAIFGFGLLAVFAGILVVGYRR